MHRVNDTAPIPEMLTIVTTTLHSLYNYIRKLQETYASIPPLTTARSAVPENDFDFVKLNRFIFNNDVFNQRRILNY